MNSTTMIDLAHVRLIRFVLGRPCDVASGAVAEDKIAAIGIRLRKWVSFHGISINVEPDLSHFGGIVPCGISEHGTTSLVDLGLPVTLADVDVALRRTFEVAFADDAAPTCEVG